MTDSRIDQLEGLAGCGGAGFSAAFKWRAVRKEAAGPEGKVVIANADEGEPGTFKDGWILSEQPEVFLRGMLLAGQEVGAARGFVYLRPEYTRQLVSLRDTIDRMVAQGWLSEGSGAVWQGAGFPGREIELSDHGLSDVELSRLEWFVEHGTPDPAGTTPRAPVRSQHHPLPPRDVGPIALAPAAGVPFRVDVCIGGGAYICGEETALLESMEGRRPQPRHKPPFPTQSGLWGLPTLMNNVETFWWAQRLVHEPDDGVGPPGGRRLYSLSGDVERPGVYEDAVGITVRELIERHGGGVKGGAEVACFIPGGAATGILPGHLLDTPMSPAELKKVGTAMGTGGVVVHAAPTRPEAVAADIMRFFAQESCSQCTPCRLGCRAFADWMSGTRSQPEREDQERWLEAMELGSICGLGFTAPVVVRQLERWFTGVQA